MKFAIQRKHIRAMLCFAAKKDIRYYLQGFCVNQDNRGTYIDSTDGHCLGRLLIDDQPMPENRVILPSVNLDALKGTKKQNDEFLHFTVDGLSVEVILTNGDKVQFTAQDARYPDCDRVIPLDFKAEDEKPSNFNPDLLVKFVDASESLYGKRQCPTLLQRGTDSIVVSFGLDTQFIGIMMPMRDSGGAGVPSWCHKPRKAPEIVDQSMTETA